MSLPRASICALVVAALLLAVVGSATAGTLIVAGHLRFPDRSGALQPQRENRVELRSADGTVLQTASTNLSGDYTFPGVSTSGATEVYVRCYTCNDYGDGNLVSVVSPGGGDLSGAYHADSDHATFTSGFQTISFDVSSGSPGKVAWWIKDDMTAAYNIPRLAAGGPDYTGRHVAEWSPSSMAATGFNTDTGNMILKGTDPNAGADTLFHVMGHSVMFNQYGYLPQPAICSTRDVKASTDLGTAWTEGWADAWAMWMTGDPVLRIAGVGVNFEAPEDVGSWAQGETVEGRVAGAIWDLVDPTDPEHLDLDGTDRYGTGSWTEIWDVARNSRCARFQDFWSRWKTLGHPRSGPVASIYQNTIDFDSAPVLLGIPNITTDEDVAKNKVVDLYAKASDYETPDTELQFTFARVPDDPGCGVEIADGWLSVKPHADWSGQVQVTLSCFDGCKYNDPYHPVTFTVTVNPIPDAPRVDPLCPVPDVAIDEDHSSDNAIDLWPSFYDPETPNSADLVYTISGNTSNGDCSVDVVGNRYVRIKPKTDWNGTCDVTVMVYDPDLLFVTDTFTITVNPVNDPPTICDIGDQTTQEDTPLDNVIDFWACAADKETGDEALTYTATSSDAGCVVSVDSGQYLDITPASNWSGSCEVTVRVTDPEGLYAEDTFTVTVTPVSDAPTISQIPDVLVSTSPTSPYTIDLWSYVSDPETAANLLSYSVVPTDPGAGVTFDGHFITISPGPTGGYSSVTVTVTDPELESAMDTFNVLVATKFSTIAEARANADETWIWLENKPCLGTIGDDVFYIEEPNRTAGMKVDYSGPVVRYLPTTVAGWLGTNGERELHAYYVTQDELASPVRPLGMWNKLLGGGSPDGIAPAVPPGAGGLYNIGLLVRATGKVMQHAGGGRFYISDGSMGTDTGSTDSWLLVDRIMSETVPPVGANVAVTGISSINLDGGTRLLRPRDGNDITTYIKVAFIYDSNAADAQSFANVLTTGPIDVTPIRLSDLPADLSKYRLILIGHDAENWATPEKVASVLNAGTRIIGVGVGGLRFFDRVTPDLYLGYDHSNGFPSERSGTVTSVLSTYMPEYAADTILELYQSTSSGGARCVYDTTGATDHLLSKVGSTSYWVLTAQHDRFFHWAFIDAPDKMTPTGRQFFIDLVNRLVQ